MGEPTKEQVEAAIAEHCAFGVEGAAAAVMRLLDRPAPLAPAEAVVSAGWGIFTDDQMVSHAFMSKAEADEALSGYTDEERGEFADVRPLFARVLSAGTAPVQEVTAWTPARITKLREAAKLVAGLSSEYALTGSAAANALAASRPAGPPGEPTPAHTGGEGQCERCLQPNPLSWFVASDVWNRVMRGGDRGNADRFGFCCPTCFIELARAVGIDPTAWELLPENHERSADKELAALRSSAAPPPQDTAGGKS